MNLVVEHVDIFFRMLMGIGGEENHHHPQMFVL